MSEPVVVETVAGAEGRPSEIQTESGSPDLKMMESSGGSSKDGKSSRRGSNEFGTSSKSSKPVRKKSMLPPGLTLEEINRQIAEVREKRKELEPTEGRVQGARIDYSVRPKKTFHHPKLDYVIGEAVHSPYLTKPQDHYPKETFTIHHTLREMKKEGKVLAEVPHEEKPFNPKHAKNKFIREVANFNPTYSMADAMAANGKTSIRASTGQLDKLLEVFNRGTRSTGGQGEYKSATLQAAEARGGPVKFKKQLSGLIARRTPSSSAMCGDDLMGAEGSTTSFYTEMTGSPEPPRKDQPLDADVSAIYGIEEFENEGTTTSDDKAAAIAQQQAVLNAYNRSKLTYVISEEPDEDGTPTAAQVAARLKRQQEEAQKPMEADKTTRSQKLKPHTTAEGEDYQEEVFEEDDQQQQQQQLKPDKSSSALLAPISSTVPSSSVVECVSPVPMHLQGGTSNSASALNIQASGGSSKGSSKNVPKVNAPAEEYDLNDFSEAPATGSSGPGTAGSSYVVDALSPVDTTGMNLQDVALGGDNVEEIPDDIAGGGAGGSNLEESYSHIEQIEYKDDFNTLEESVGNDGPINNRVDNYVEVPSQ